MDGVGRLCLWVVGIGEAMADWRRLCWLERIVLIGEDCSD